MPLGGRTCEECGFKMPPYRPRQRHPETGKLVCPGCHPDGKGNPSMPQHMHSNKEASLTKGAPFAGYEDFDACVAANQDKDNPEAYCGSIKHKVEGAAGEPLADVITYARLCARQAEGASVRRVSGTDVNKICDAIGDESNEAVKWARGCAAQAGTASVTRLSGTSLLYLCDLAESRVSTGSKTAGTMAKDLKAKDLIPGMEDWIEIASTQPSGRDVIINFVDGTSWTVPATSTYDLIRGREASRKVAHDSGDGETIYHCPFCGGGNVIARSDGTTECGFCQTAFTVQVQPMHSNMPQTIDGVPVNQPGMPGDPGVPGDVSPEQQPDAGVFEPPDATAPAFTPPAGPIQPPVASKAQPFYVTAKGVALDEDAFLRHLALAYADDRDLALAQVRSSRGLRD